MFELKITRTYDSMDDLENDGIPVYNNYTISKLYELGFSDEHIFSAIDEMVNACRMETFDEVFTMIRYDAESILPMLGIDDCYELEEKASQIETVEDLKEAIERHTSLDDEDVKRYFQSEDFKKLFNLYRWTLMFDFLENDEIDTIDERISEWLESEV